MTRKVLVVLADGSFYADYIEDDNQDKIGISMTVNNGLIAHEPLIVPIEEYEKDGNKYLIARQYVAITDNDVESAINNC
jgi:hypothetical protein